MNRAVQRLHRRRCALKNNAFGGGLLVNPETPLVSNNGVPYPDNQSYSECYDPVRPGALPVQANPELAQVAMAGGNSYSHPSRRLSSRLAGGYTRRHRVAHSGGYNVMSAAQLTAMMGKRGGSRQCGLRGGGCGCNWKLRGGQCGKPEVAWLGGKRTLRNRKQRGGLRGFELNVADNVGGMGPIAEPARIAIPCDARAGMQNPFTATPMQPDSRATFGYSLTPNTTMPSVQAGGRRTRRYHGGQLSERVPNFEYSQTGAGYGGNAYDASCYRAPGSEMPVYPATSAGFHFTPSTEAGATLPDGITAFNEVVAHTARLGGGRRSKRSMRSRRKSYRKKAKKAKRTRRQ